MVENKIKLSTLIIATQMICAMSSASAQDKIIKVDNILFNEQLLSNGFCRGYSLVEYRIDDVAELELLKTYSLPDSGACKKKSLIRFNQDIADNSAEFFFQIIQSIFFNINNQNRTIVAGSEAFAELCKNETCPSSTQDINAVYYNPCKNIYEMYFSVNERRYVSRIHTKKTELENIEIKIIM